jgi:hypothetical protein
MRMGKVGSVCVAEKSFDGRSVLREKRRGASQNASPSLSLPSVRCENLPGRREDGWMDDQRDDVLRYLGPPSAR